MEIIAAIILAGVVGYCFLKHITKRGSDTVRAFLYLAAIDSGATVEEANEAVSIDITNAPTEFIRGAKEHVRIAYEGKQLAMIADAKSQGFRLR